MRQLVDHYIFETFFKSICASVMCSHPISGLCKHIRLCAVFVAGMREIACSLCDGLWICVDVRAGWGVGGAVGVGGCVFMCT